MLLMISSMLLIRFFTKEHTFVSASLPYILLQAMLVVMLASLFTAFSAFLFLNLKADRAFSSCTSEGDHRLIEIKKKYS